MDRRNTEELMTVLGLEGSLDRMAKASSMRWYGHVLRRMFYWWLYNSNCWVTEEGPTETNVEKTSIKGNEW